MFRSIALYFAVTTYSLRTVSQRISSSLSAVVGIAGVVAVLISVLSIGRGFERTLAQTGSDDVALIMRSGANGELSSGLTLDTLKIIEDTPGIARNDARPMVSGELFVLVAVPRKSSGTDANVPLRGISQFGPGLRKQFSLTAGRMYEAGRDELIVGSAAVEAFAGLDIGKKIQLGEASWTIVGHFSTGGTVSDTEIWADAKVLQPAYRRGTSYQSVRAKLESAAGFQPFKDTLATDPRLDVGVQRESDFYAAQSVALTTLVTVLGYLLAGGMGLGAVFGAFNTMYTAISARTREIATLRAVGFPSIPVMLAILTESVFLALVGGSLGAGLAYGVFNGYQASTINFQSFSQVAFAFDVSPDLIVQGIVYATLLGLVGGIIPAWRASHMAVASALREV